MIMGGVGSGKPRISAQMAAWYRQYRVPEGATVDLQFAAFDSVLVNRPGVSLEQARSFRRAMPRLDMLVILPSEVRIVELKPDAQLRDLGQAEQYRTSLRRDIFVGPLLDRPLRVVLCTLHENENVRALCEAQDIEYIVIPVSELPELPA